MDWLERQIMEVDWSCVNCGKSTINQFFVLTPQLKQKALSKSKTKQNDTGHAWMCITCIEKLVGRELTPDDFPDWLSCNNGETSSILLANRSGMKVNMTLRRAEDG